MRRSLLLLLFAVSLSACSHVPETPIYKIYELCGKNKSDPAVVAKFKELGLEDEGGGKGYFRYYEPKTRTDYKLVDVRINPQPGLESIQGFFITWQHDLGGLTYEEIQQMIGISLPRRGAKETRTSQFLDTETQYYVQNHESLHHIDSQVTVTCAKNDYGRCWEIDIACFGFVHPD